MSVRFILPLVAIVLGGCAPAKSAAADSARFRGATGVLPSEQSKWIVSLSGIGPIRFGMPVADVARVLNDPALLPRGRDASCRYVRPKGLPRGAALMISGGIVVRLDVDSAGTITESGLGVGDSEVAVLVRNSGRTRIASNKYRGPLAHDLVVTSPTDAAHLMIFETDGRSIRAYRAGNRAAVQLVERCG